MFRFKQFTINDDRCAMKVGTDGVLLGAWAHIGDGARVLDVGAGSGLIALMLAQRFPTARITALELDAAAASQASENIAASPFADRVEVLQTDFLNHTAQPYDAIVSNPPFFEEDLLPPNADRANARHTAAGLTFDALVSHSIRLLSDGGTLQVIIPKTAQDRFHAICCRHDLSLVSATDIRTVERKAPKRVLLQFVRGASTASVVRDELTLMAGGQRTEAYSCLCRDFYL